MLLEDLNTAEVVNGVLIETSSTALEQFIYDKLKLKFHVDSNTLIEITNGEDIKELKNIMYINPPFSDCWFVKINMDKIKLGSVLSLLNHATSCFFFLTCSNYSNFKNIKEAIRVPFYFYYLMYLKRADIVFLYDSLVPERSRLSKRLFDFCVKSYSSDIDILFNLLEQLNKGVTFNNTKEIMDACGIGSLTTEEFLFSVITPLSGSDRGLRTMLKNRVRSGMELGKSLGFDTFYNYLKNNIKLFLELKMLLMTGTIYKSVRNLPKGYLPEEKQLVRYNKYIWRLNNIPTSALVRVYNCMGERWKNDLDYLGFVYRYYGQKLLTELPQYEGIIHNKIMSYEIDGEAVINAHGDNGVEPTRICPNCGMEKPISQFGFRRMEEGGEVRNQSWCRTCRNTSAPNKSNSDFDNNRWIKELTKDTRVTG